MFKRLTTACLTLLASASLLQAQDRHPVKFGVHFAPGFSFMGSNEKKVSGDGSVGNFRLGLELEFYIGETENYAITLGTNFSTGNGGRLKYEDGGRLLRNSRFDLPAFTNSAGTTPASYFDATEGPERGVFFSPGTSIRYTMNYVELPIAFKLRTNPIGDLPLRAFFHIPMITPMVGISGRGTINAPKSGDLYTNRTDVFGGDSKGENIYSDMNFFQIALGVGAGVEFKPTDDGLRIIGGFYYQAGLLDITKRVGLPDPTQPNTTTTEIANPRTGFHNINLRLGVIF